MLVIDLKSTIRVQRGAVDKIHDVADVLFVGHAFKGKRLTIGAVDGVAGFSTVSCGQPKRWT